MTITFSMTARDIATKAMQERKIIALGVTPKAKEEAYCLQTLNLMFKTWAARGLTLWTEEAGTATVEANNPIVTLAPRPIDVSSVNLLAQPGYERPMTRWEKGEYDTLPNKAQRGQPLIYSPTYKADGMGLRIWPVPVADMTILYTYSRVIQDVVQPADPVDVPQMWLEAVTLCLAAKLNTFGDGGDPGHLAKIIVDAANLEQQMFDHDRPASYLIGSDYYA